MTHPSTPPPPPPSSSPPPLTNIVTTINNSTNISIQLYFDPSLENQVLKSWNSLARRHISTHLIDTSSRPHLNLITFSSSSSLDPLKLLSPLRSLSSRLDPLPLTLSSISTLPSSAGDVIFLSPTPTIALLQLQSQVVDVVRKEGGEVGEEWRVEGWVPRCDVAREVPRGRVGDGVSVLREMRMPVSGYVVEVGVVEGGVEGGREIGVLQLGSGGEQ